MSESQRSRRPVQEDAPEGTAGRRGCLLAGALLGIVAGVLVALFVVPPLFDHYFGEATVKAGKVYDGDGKRISVDFVSRYEAGRDGKTPFLGVQFRVRSEAAWAPDPGNFVLELEGGIKIGPVPPVEKIPVMWPQFAAGQERPFELLFELPTGARLEGATVRFRDPKVRFELPAAASEGR